MIAKVKDENLGALGDFASDADGEAVGVGGGQRELPEWKTEAAAELFANPEGIFGGEHQGDAFADAAGDGFSDDWRRVAGHRAGVAEAEVDVAATVDIGEMGALRGFYEEWEWAGPFLHPVHGHPTEQRGQRALIKSGRLGMIGDESPSLASVKLV